MQGSSTSASNKILKFSILIEIFSYWDSPHKWMQFWLRMNKKTLKIWKSYYKDFWLRAENLRGDIILYQKLTDSSAQRVLDIEHLFIKLIFYRKDIKTLMTIANILKDDRVIVIYPSKK